MSFQSDAISAYPNGSAVSKDSVRDLWAAVDGIVANGGKVFGSRSAAVSSGQANLPAVLTRIITMEGTFAEPKMVIRQPGDGTGADALFGTPPFWSVQMIVDPLSYTRDSLVGFSSRSAAVAAGQDSLPINAKVMLNLEGTDLVMRGWLHTADDPLFDTSPRWGVITRWSSGGGGNADMDAVRYYAAPRNLPRASNTPIMTDGRSLHRLRGAMGKLKAGVAGVKPKIILTGDSWNELNPIPVAVRTLFEENYPMSGWGWWPSVPAARFSNPGAGYSRTGDWVIQDATAVSSLPYGSGIDGMMLTATGTTETATLSNVQVNELRIYSRNYGGAFRYSVDGGAPVTVTHLNNGGLTVTTISGLSDADHSIVIDTIGNTGRVALAGFYLTKTVAGVEILRAGNGGARGAHLSMWAGNIQSIAADLQPDAVVTILGTNDYRVAEGTVDAYLDGLRAMRDAYRAAVPDCGFVFVAPALSGGTVVTPQSDYRDALYNFCLTEGHEFYNMTDDWSAYAVSNSHGLWNDNLHPNDAGGTVFATRILPLLLGI